ncbi:MAG TPA: T9SS type A sorting domain-containing protein, partial [Flavobacteriales bacterium]|nr:T9SS type A sorting domain-containing protein [Flavobacteriales bacterium]
HTCGGWCGGCGSPSGEENLTEEKARVYPNPFENSLTIDHAELVQEFILYDVFGKLIFSQAVTQNTINTQLLPGGLYIYEIRLKDGDVKKGKLVKE